MTAHDPAYERQRSDQDIAALAMAFRSGDRLAFDALYGLFHAKVFRFCRRMMGDEILAKDAFQETFIRMFEHRMDLRGDNVRSWLFSIARRVCLNQLRSRRIDHDAFDEGLHGGPHHQAESDVLLREQIERALLRLPLPLREALVLREYEGHSYQEIADIVGIDLSLAKVRVYRARLMMRRYLSAVVTQDR